jgi:hypothetical protein
MATANAKKLNPRLKTIAVSDPSLVQLRDEVRKLLPEADKGEEARGVSATIARQALIDAINSVPDEELRNFRGGQIMVVL